MKQIMLQEKYPVFVLEIGKQETTCKSIDDVVARLKTAIAADSRVAWIAEFDHYAHTTKLGGAIAPEIKAAKNLVFCFGLQLPNPNVARRAAALDRHRRLRRQVHRQLPSTAPMKPANEAMEGWAKALLDAA